MPRRSNTACKAKQVSAESSARRSSKFQSNAPLPSHVLSPPRVDFTEDFDNTLEDCIGEYDEQFVDSQELDCRGRESSCEEFSEDDIFEYDVVRENPTSLKKFSWPLEVLHAPPTQCARRNKGQHHRLFHGDVEASTSSAGVSALKDKIPNNMLGQVTSAMEDERYVPNDDCNMLRVGE